MKEPKQNPMELELNKWQMILKTPEWEVFAQLMQDHADWLRKDVDKYLKAGDYRMADRAQAKLEDTKTILGLVQARVKLLRSKTGG